MNTAAAQSLLSDFDETIDDLEESLQPLLTSTLASATSRMPLVDRAKLFVLTTYAIESILFSYLRLNGVDAKEHAIFRELTRVKEYFAKIKAAEAGPVQRPTNLDKAAAARFVKQGLAGNDRYDHERHAREHGKRRAEELQQSSQWGSHSRFESTAKRMRMQEAMIPVVRANGVEDEKEVPSSSTQAPQSKAERKAAKQQRRLQAETAKQSPASDPEQPEQYTADGAANEDTSASDTEAVQTSQVAKDSPALGANAEHKKRRQKRKRKTRSELQQELEDVRALEMK